MSEMSSKVYTEEAKIANVLIYGSPAAKQEIIIRLIYIENINALSKILNAMPDREYHRVMPTA